MLRAGPGAGVCDLVDLLLGLGGGAVLGPAALLLVLPGRTGLTHVRPDVDGVTLWTAEARLRPTVYVQRRGGVATGLDVGG